MPTSRRSEHKLPQPNPKIAALERALHELRRAPLFNKAAAAEQVAALSLELFRELDTRVGGVEEVAHTPVPVLHADDVERELRELGRRIAKVEKRRG